ncbi:hypothetical protein LFML04_2383 [Leptospirillum ferriphilum ML-04]|uniref:Uncharacterized protein n=1 Tax=Leptospirillum ferriphilum (strain ML-04) TaxID=1048260 RepID=J9ZF42_LEPFM|nr:hypothetical protein LFML04_2383 [Leptospirillum ferriphilum ML-04]
MIDEFLSRASGRKKGNFVFKVATPGIKEDARLGIQEKTVGQTFLVLFQDILTGDSLKKVFSVLSFNKDGWSGNRRVKRPNFLCAIRVSETSVSMIAP